MKYLITKCLIDGEDEHAEREQNQKKGKLKAKRKGKLKAKRKEKLKAKRKEKKDFFKVERGIIYLFELIPDFYYIFIKSKLYIYIYIYAKRNQSPSVCFKIKEKV